MTKGMTGTQRPQIAILDFGSQYTRLIARRVREAGAYCEIHPPGIPAGELALHHPIGIILSGGPDSVYGSAVPRVDPEILRLGLPVLGICYGMHLLTQSLGGKVESVGDREYGATTIQLLGKSDLFQGLGPTESVWMSHGDESRSLPEGFVGIARTPTCPFAAMANEEKRIYGIQFHPEVSHTPHGNALLRNFLFRICRCDGTWRTDAILEECLASIRDRVGSERVLCALSGGVDSAVTALMVERAIGDRLTCLFVDTGLLRKDESAEVSHAFSSSFRGELRIRQEQSRFFQALRGVTEPEEKRRIIGRLFIEIFEEEADRLEGIPFLAQGTLYPDRIESFSVAGPSKTIKTQHKVGGLPEPMSLKLVEPRRNL
ncbi:MAG: glutamine-hydrolyzing GMP synthase, partial [Acidobacteria bacterium]|nr:glutamine-hydrolyzing GMP synthase [Acidobacteriota bacterium]